MVQSGSQLKMHVSFNHVFVENLFYRHLWKLSSPKNVVIYIWRLLVNRLPTMDNLLSRGVDVQYMGSTVCPLCQVCNEIMEHLFFTCKFASIVWNQCYSRLGLVTTQHKDPIKNFHLHDCSWLGSSKNKVW